MLVLIMIVLIIGDVLQGRACGEHNGPIVLGVQANPVEFGELVASQGLNIEEGSRRNPKHTS